MGDLDLEAIEEIKQLKARYFRLLDTKQWDEWGQVFTDDVRMEVPEGGVELDGRDAIVQGVSGALAGTTTAHHGHMPEITVTGSTATGIWAMFDYVEWPPGEDGARSGLMGFGHYHETYAKGDDGRWRIAKLRLERIRIDPL